VLNQASLVIAQALRQIGMNVQLAASDWGGVTTRRANRNPPDRGGWNVFFTYGDGNGYANPIVAIVHAANGDGAWFGWPQNARNEQLRDEWAAAPTLEQRREVARMLNRNMFDYVQDIKTGQWIQPAGYRSDRMRGLQAMPQIAPWWTAERFA
jgi:peptide/nickel transport system substrate-binding protein